MNQQISQFQETVWDYYAKHGRDLPWRHAEANGTFDPYKIMVSEIMLQQTQVPRVVTKYLEFITTFPNVDSLACSNLHTVFGIWNGLGYNRRAKFLLESAKQVQQQGLFPNTLDELIKLPGIGKNTAAAICVYAYNQPLVFIETNIRTVYIHEFFKDKIGIDDKELLPLIKQTLDQENPREWYWALMDYGSYIKSEFGNASRFSRHHTTQSQYEGSKRQLRAKVLKSLLSKQKTGQELDREMNDSRLVSVIKDLEKEQLIIQQNKYYRLA